MEKEHRETTQLLVEQNRNLRKISFQDLDRRRIAEDLHEELESDPKLFGGSFNFTADFVGRLKTFMSEVVEKLEQAINQNEVLRKALEGMKQAKERAEELLQEEWKTQRLETENQNLRQREQRVKRFLKNLLEDIQRLSQRKRLVVLISV